MEKLTDHELAQLVVASETLARVIEVLHQPTSAA